MPQPRQHSSIPLTRRTRHVSPPLSSAKGGIPSVGLLTGRHRVVLPPAYWLPLREGHGLRHQPDGGEELPVVQGQSARAERHRRGGDHGATSSVGAGDADGRQWQCAAGDHHLGRARLPAHRDDDRTRLEQPAERGRLQLRLLLRRRLVPCRRRRGCVRRLCRKLARAVGLETVRVCVHRGKTDDAWWL